MLRLAVPAWLCVVLIGCQCEPAGVTPVYACTDDNDCIEGYVCGKVSHTCVTKGTVESPDGGTGGGVGGSGGSGGSGGGDAGGTGGSGGGGGSAGGGAGGGSAGGGGGGGAAGGGGGAAGGGGGAAGGGGGGAAGGGGGAAGGGGGAAGGGGGAAGGGGGSAGGGGAAGGGGGSAGGGGAGGGSANGPTSLVFTSMVPSPLLAGTCLSTTIQARRMTTATAVAADTTVSLTEISSGTLRYYSDAACTTAITSTTIAAGNTDATFYTKPLTGGSSSQIATAAFGSGARSLTIVGAARRGNCTFNAPTNMNLPDGGVQVVEDNSAFCNISPGHAVNSHVLLVFSATTSSSSAGTAMIRCKLNSLTQVACYRGDGAAVTTVHWQTVELPTGLRVERTSGTCSGPTQLATIPNAVNLANSFLVKSYSVGSSDLDDDDLSAMRLISPTQIELAHGDNGGSCNGGAYEIQVAELAGLTAIRGVEDAGMPVGSYSLAFTGLPAASLNAALLTSHSTTDNMDPTCSNMVRGDLTTPTSVTFTRGGGLTDGGCATTPIYKPTWERLDFGTRATVQTKVVTLPPATSTLPVPISPVDTTRTIVFSSSQAAAGQAAGESNYNNGPNGNNYPSEQIARFELASSTSVNVIRQRANGTATFTFYVVELDP